MESRDRLILPPPETTLRRQADQYFLRQSEITPAIVVESVSYLANRSMLRSHDLIGFMPAPVARLDIEAGLLARLDWAVPFGAGPVGVSHRGAASLSPASAAFLAALHSAAERIVAQV